jgi:hypothetical protein
MSNQASPLAAPAEGTPASRKLGLSSLPFSAGIILGAGISSKLVERLAPRAVAGPGLVMGAGGMFWLSLLSVHSSYVAHVLPARHQSEWPGGGDQHPLPG